MQASTGGPGRRLGRFFLVDGLEQAPRLSDDDFRHVTRVLRAGPGDCLTGVDGRGGSLPLEVRAADRRRLELTSAGDLVRVPAPGAEGSPLPSVAVACAPPRPGRLEPMLDRLTQLGVARIHLLACRHTGPEDRRPKPERLARVLRESAKQSGTAWLPELEGPSPVESLSFGAGTAWLCDPSGGVRLWDQLTQAAPQLASRVSTPGGSRPEPSVTILIGPEGGFAPEERERLQELGALPVRLGASILRIETAAEAAAAATLLAAAV